MKAIDKQVGGGHYKNMVIQPIVFCQANNLNACESNIVKYACRHKQKGRKKDLEKVIHYAQMLIELEYEGEDNAKIATETVEATDEWLREREISWDEYQRIINKSKSKDEDEKVYYPTDPSEQTGPSEGPIASTQPRLPLQLELPLEPVEPYPPLPGYHTPYQTYGDLAYPKRR